MDILSFSFQLFFTLFFFLCLSFFPLLGNGQEGSVERRAEQVICTWGIRRRNYAQKLLVAKEY